MRKVRIKDIAEIANVSIGTVDRVIHNRGEVSACNPGEDPEIAWRNTITSPILLPVHWL